MIIKFLNKTISVFLTLIFITGLFPTFVFSDPSSSFLSTSEIRGFNKSVFDSHFSRADRELNPERWLAEAKLGITQAIGAWELIASNLYDNPLLIAEAKHQIENWSKEELEKRFSQWLVGRFFLNSKLNSLLNFSQSMDETQKKYSWYLDDQGNILFDEKTGDPLIIRPDEENNSFSQDIIKWREQANNHINNSLKSFDNNLLLLYPELLAYIPDELREKTNNLIVNNLLAMSNSIKTEFENIIAIEERKFISRRTRDIWSLRSKSENESAKMFTEKLIAETEEACKNGINSLIIKIEQAEAGTGDLALLGEEWLQLYKDQFDRGLKAWEDAEERFFARRIEWEHDSLNLFQNGIEVWQTAFKDFEEQRNLWEKEAETLFNAGKKLFMDINDDLEKNITAAKIEFDLNKAMRIGEGTTRVKALIDMYLICSSAALSSKENLQFWYDQYDDTNKANLKDDNFYSWVLTCIEKIDNEIKTISSSPLNIGKINKLNQSLTELKEMKNSYNMYNNYKENALEARKKILDNYSNLFDFGSLKDFLLPGASSEDFYLDEYQLSLIRAKALVTYYKNKTAIAEAVSAYAKELTAGRMTEAEGLKAWEDAKNAYTASLTAYETELQNLTVIGNNLQSKQIVLSNLASALQQEEAKLNQLLSDYTALVSSSTVNMQNVFRTELKTKYEFLIEDYKKLFYTKEESLYSNALIYGLNWGQAEQIEIAQNYLNILINGNDSDLLSLTELEKSELEIDIKIRYALINLFADDTSGELRAFNSNYSGADWYSKVTGYKFSEKEEKSSFYGDNLYSRLYEDYNLLLQADPESIPEYNDKIYFYENLYKYFNQYASFSLFIQKEIWQNSCLLLSSLIKKYDFSSSLIFLPEPLELCNSIKKKQGDFLQNASQFLIEFDNCFSLLPEWLGLEINNWKESFIGFIAAFALNNDIKTNKSLNDLKTEKEEIQKNIIAKIESSKKENITEEEINSINTSLSSFFETLSINNYQYQITNTFKYYENVVSAKEKNWREYLTEKYIDKLDPAIKSTTSNKSGIYEDAFDNSIFNTKRINEALSLYSNSQILSLEENSDFYYKLYNRETSQISGYLYYLDIKYKEIADTAKAYDYSKLNIEEINKKKAVLEIEKNTQEKNYNEKKSEYLQEANQFIGIGNLYDIQYSIAKEAYENIEQKRFDYEKYDAIQRWASTSYLGVDVIKLDENKTKLEKAEIVLFTLSSLNNKNNSQQKNPEYDALFSAYKEMFSVKLLLTEAQETEISEYAYEYNRYQQLFDNYSNSLNQFGYAYLDYNNYILPENKEKWTLKNIITINNEGLLAFSMDRNMAIIGTSAETALALNDYLTEKINPNNEYKTITAFENALRGLSERMAVYFKDEEKFKQWSYAGDYLLYELMNKNDDLKYLKEAFTGTGKLDGDLGSVTIIDVNNKNFLGTINSHSSLKNIFLHGALNVMKKEYQDSWVSLSEQEKADLEFYVILSLSGGNDYLKGFLKMFSMNIYDAIYKSVKNDYDNISNALSKWYNFLFYPILSEARDVDGNALERIKSVKNETEEQVNKWINNLKNYLSTIESYASAYNKSLEKLRKINGIAESSKNITWDNIKLCLQKNKRGNEEELEEIKKYWIKMNGGLEYKNTEIISALSEFISFINIEEIRIKNNLDTFWAEEIKNQEKNKNDFLTEVNSFIAGTSSQEKLKSAAEKAYGENVLSIKNYYNDSHDVLINNLSKYLEIDTNLSSLFGNFGNDLSLLIGEMLDNKYNAELTAREIEWDLIRKDLNEKGTEWILYVDLIIETGRTDWITSRQKMESALNQWQVNFQKEYNRVSNEWNEAYLASLEDKEEWLQKAADAANNASAESFLLLIGTEGERLSRMMDTREPLGIRIDINEANTLMAELLQSSGIINMSKAFASLNNITSSISTSVKRGLKGSSWDAAREKVIVSDFVRKTNAEIADSETRKLAYNAKLMAEEAKKGLTENVNTANNNFKSSMDDLFVFSGLWTKTGNNYEKNIIKGATLLTSIITQRVTIEGYDNYILQPIILETNLNSDYLASLDTLAIRGLLESAYNEIELIAKEIFGTGKEAIIKPTTKEQENERSQSPGKFGEHIGYSPDQKPSDEMGESKKDMFYDQGGGEVGRLVSEYIYWAVIDGKGNYELNMAPWDKRLWNDEGSWFKAPNLRTIGTIACSIIAGAVTGGMGWAGIAISVGISSASEVVFTSLDVACGYKNADEAFVNLGKTLLTNTVTAFGGALFGGIGPLTGSDKVVFKGLTEMAAGLTKSSVGQIIIKTVMTGIQTATTATITNAISGITYNSEDGFGYNKDVFNRDFGKNLGISMLTSMTGTFVTSSLTAIGAGLDFSKADGFNPLQNIEQSKLFNLVGSLAAQGVNYALGNDFTLNLLNASLFSNGKLNGGLLELHFGRDGVTMNVGMGGANVSIDNIIDSVKGAMHWNVNNRITKYGKEENFDALVTLRAQYGYGDSVQKDQLWDILNGDATLNTDANGDYAGKTTIVDGKRVVTLSGYSEGMSRKDQMRLAITLGHEAYRDGITTSNNNLETRTAVLSHTEMAIRMLNAKEKITMDENLISDIIAYYKGVENFNNYIDTHYDSSADFWRVIMNSNGGVDKVFWDGDYQKATIVDADGNERTVSLQTGSVSAALAAAVGNGITKSQMNDIMVKSGLDYQDGVGWYAKYDSAIYVPSEPQELIPEISFWKKLADKAQNIKDSALNTATNALNNAKNFITNLFNKNKDFPTTEEIITKGNIFTINDSSGEIISLLKIDADNPVLAVLIKQYDAAFASIPAIEQAGCNFLLTLAYAQLVTGQILTAEQQMEIWNMAKKDPDILQSNGYVGNQDKIAAMALDVLGRNDIRLAFGGPVEGVESTLIGYRLKTPYQNTGHFLVGDIFGNLVWDPYTTDKTTEINRSVYVYPRY
ncbi:MAG: hypothetical protein FWB73_01145 [Treponema sp.]|nr:hypothetical protein [Treponema sp.]